MKDYTQPLKEDPILQKSINAFQEIFDGNFWVIGGSVYRNIIKKLYGISSDIKDIDIVFDGTESQLNLSDDFDIKRGSFGNLKVIYSGIEMDFIPLTNINSITRRGLSPKIENYLTGVPLNIQSIVYNVKEDRIIGNMGLQSILNKTITINDLEEAKTDAKRQKISVTEMVRKKADEFNFNIT